MTKTKDLHTICLAVCWQLLAQQTLSNKILMKAIKLVMMNHANHFARDRSKRRKTENETKLTLTVFMILLIQNNYQQDYQIPWKQPLIGFGIFIVMSCWMWLLPKPTYIQPAQRAKSTSSQWIDQGCYQHFAIVWLVQGTLLWAVLVYVTWHS